MSTDTEPPKRARCFFDITISNVEVGRIVFELFLDVCPITCENFRALCTGEKGNTSDGKKPLHYAGCRFHRIVKGFMIQSGDFTLGNGKGGQSIYGSTFADENFKLKHDEEFLLSMANKGPNTNGSQFFITTVKCPHLDNKHTVFGKVVSGQEIVKLIENQPVSEQGHKPKAEIVIEKSGELVLQKRKKAKKEKKPKKESKKKKKTKKKEKEDEGKDAGTDKEGSSSDNEESNSKKQLDTSKEGSGIADRSGDQTAGDQIQNEDNEAGEKGDDSLQNENEVENEDDEDVLDIGVSKPEQMALQEAIDDEQPSISKKLPDIISSHNSDEPSSRTNDNKEPENTQPEVAEPTEYFCSINPEEIPPVPEKKFLTRVKPEDDMKDKDKDAVDEKGDNSRVEIKPGDKESKEIKKRGKEGEWRIGPDGMKIKGRGMMRFDPRMDRERSVTPPHWRNAHYYNNPRRMPPERSRYDENPERRPDRPDHGSGSARDESRDRLSAFARLEKFRKAERDAAREDGPRERNYAFDKFYRQKEEERLELLKARGNRKRSKGREEKDDQNRRSSDDFQRSTMPPEVEEKVMKTLSERIAAEMKYNRGPADYHPRDRRFNARDPIPFRPRSPKKVKNETGAGPETGIDDEIEDGQVVPGKQEESDRHRMSRDNRDDDRSSRKRGNRDRPANSHEQMSPKKKEKTSNSAANEDEISWRIQKSISERFKAIANYSDPQDDNSKSKNKTSSEKEPRPEIGDYDATKRSSRKGADRSTDRNKRSRSRDKKEKSPVKEIKREKSTEKQQSNKMEKKSGRKVEPPKKSRKSNSRERRVERANKSKSRSKDKTTKRKNSLSPGKRRNRSRSWSKNKDNQGKSSRDPKSRRSRSKDRGARKTSPQRKSRSDNKSGRKREKSSSVEDLFNLSALV